MNCQDNGGCPFYKPSIYLEDDFGFCHAPQEPSRWSGNDKVIKRGKAYDCNLTPSLFPLFRRALTGSLSEQERAVCVAIGRGEWSCGGCAHGLPHPTWVEGVSCEGVHSHSKNERACAKYQPKEQP